MPNTVDLAFDIDKFDASKKITYDGLIEIYELTKKISSAPIQIGSTGGWGELKAQASSLRESVEQLQSSYANLSSVQKAYSQASKDEAKASSDLQKAKLNEAKASKETALASAAEAKASKDNAAAMLLEAKAANELERAKTAANKVPKAPPQSQADYVASVPFTINAVGSEEATKAAEAQGVAINELEAAQIADTIAAKEWANAQLQAAGVSADVNAATTAQVTESEALLKAKEALIQAQSEENVIIQGYRLQAKEATLAAQEQAAVGLGLHEEKDIEISDYKILTKAYEDAAVRYKDLAILQRGMPISEKGATIAAAQEVRVLDEEIKRLDADTGRANKSVGLYNEGIKNVNVVNGTANKSAGGFLSTMSKQRIAFMDLGRAAEGSAFSLRAIASNFALFGPQVTIAAAAVGGLIYLLFKQDDAHKRAAEAAKKQADGVKDLIANYRDMATIGADSQGGSIGEATKVQVLASAVSDLNRPYKERNNALLELKEINKSYFGDLTLEQSSISKLTGLVDEYTAAIVNQAIVKELESDIGKVAVAYSRQSIEIKKNIDEVNKLKGAMYDARSGIDKYADIEKIAKLNDVIKQQVKEIDPLGKQYENLKKEIQDATLAGLDFKLIKPPKTTTKDTELKTAKDKEYEDDVKREIQLNKELSKSDELGLAERISLRENAFQLEADLLNKDRDRYTKNEEDKLNDVLKYGKSSKNQKLNAESEYRAAIDQINKKFYDQDNQLSIDFELDKMVISAKSHADLLAEDKAANELFLEQQSDFYKKQEDKAQKSADKAQETLASTRDAALLHLDATRGTTVEDEKSYQNGRLKIEHDYLRASLEQNIEYTDQMIQLAKSRREDTTKQEADLEKLKREKADNDSNYQKQTADTEKKTWQTYFDGIASLATKTNGFIKSLVDGAYTKQENAIQDLIKANNDWESAETTRIENSSLSEQDKAAALIQTKATGDAQDKKLAQEQKDLEIRKARFAKASAIAQIIINTAVAISKVLDDPFQIAIAAGAGAIELATAIATPIPTYADGTENHPGGPAIAGEAGLELVQPKGGRPVLVNKATLFPDLSAGSRVTPLTDQDITQAMHGGAMASMADRVSIMEALNNKASNNAWEVARWQVRETKKALEASTRQQPVNVVIRAPNEKWQKSINKNVFGR